MNKLIRYIRSLIGVICILCMVSCQSDDAPDAGSIRLVFRIYMPTATTQTRSNESGTEIGEDWECAVNPDQLHVVLYEPDGTSIGGLEHVVLVKTSEPNVYDVTGSMLLSKFHLQNGIFNGKIMVYANIASVDEQAKFTEEFVNQLQFDYHANSHFIPMWGVKQLGINLEAGKQTQIGIINLLRAEAKVKVELRDDMTDNYELSKVTLSQAHSSGYALPQYANIHQLQDVQLLEHAAFSHFLNTDTKITNLDLSKDAIYVPEYDNQDKAQAACIQLTLRDKRTGTEKDYTLPFVEYDETGAPTDTPVDIVRNHYYQFVVYKGDDDMLDIQLNVRKWYFVQHDDIYM